MMIMVTVSRRRKILLGGWFISWLCITMMRMMMIIFMWRWQVFFTWRSIARLDIVMMVFLMRRWKILLTGWLISWLAVMVRGWWSTIIISCSRWWRSAPHRLLLLMLLGI